jgi:hypothetical protein
MGDGWIAATVRDSRVAVGWIICVFHTFYSIEAAHNAGDGVICINIEPKMASVVRIVAVFGCFWPVRRYFDRSVQIPTRIVLSCRCWRVRLLFNSYPVGMRDEQAHVDADLWPRLTLLTRKQVRRTVELSTTDIWPRLYHEEGVGATRAGQIWLYLLHASMWNGTTTGQQTVCSRFCKMMARLNGLSILQHCLSFLHDGALGLFSLHVD